MSEIDEAYFRATGKHHPSMPSFLGWIVTAVIGSMTRMHKIHLEQDVYNAHLREAREVLPDMTSFGCDKSMALETGLDRLIMRIHTHTSCCELVFPEHSLFNIGDIGEMGYTIC